MKKLALDNAGGMPYDQNDLKWLQDGFYEALALYIKQFRVASSGILIVEGCEASANGADVDVEAGVLLIDDELVAWSGATVAVGTGFLTPAFEVDSSYDASGNETYKNQTVNDTYEITFAALNQSGSALTQQQFIDTINGFERMETWFHDKIIEAWQDFSSFHANVTTPSTYSPGADTPLRYRKTAYNRVEITGDFQITAGSGSIIVATLPVGYRPDARRYLKILIKNLTTAQDDAGNAYSELRIDTDGKIHALAHASDTLYYICHGLSFELNVL